MLLFLYTLHDFHIYGENFSNTDDVSCICLNDSSVCLNVHLFVEYLCGRNVGGDMGDETDGTAEKE